LTKGLLSRIQQQKRRTTTRTEKMFISTKTKELGLGKKEEEPPADFLNERLQVNISMKSFPLFDSNESMSCYCYPSLERIRRWKWKEIFDLKDWDMHCVTQLTRSRRERKRPVEHRTGNNDDEWKYQDIIWQHNKLMTLWLHFLLSPKI
jgi:hypothetical protein